MDRDKEDNKEANAMLAGGAAIAAIGIAGAVAGAVCPVCVVAAPALLGIGAVRKLRASRRQSRAGAGEEAPSTDGDAAHMFPGTRSP